MTLEQLERPAQQYQLIQMVLQGLQGNMEQEQQAKGILGQVAHDLYGEAIAENAYLDQPRQKVAQTAQAVTQDILENLKKYGIPNKETIAHQAAENALTQKGGLEQLLLGTEPAKGSEGRLIQEYHKRREEYLDEQGKPDYQKFIDKYFSQESFPKLRGLLEKDPEEAQRLVQIYVESPITEKIRTDFVGEKDGKQEIKKESVDKYAISLVEDDEIAEKNIIPLIQLIYQKNRDN